MTANRTWEDLTESERDDLAVFLLAVNSEVALVDGKMSAREADIDRIFQVILARSRGNVIRNALFHLHDDYRRLGSQLLPAGMLGPGPHDFIGSRIARVREVLASLDHEEMRRYLVGVLFIGVATGEADGPVLGPKLSRQEKDRVDAIVSALGLPLAGSDETLAGWLKRGDA